MKMWAEFYPYIKQLLIEKEDVSKALISASMMAEQLDKKHNCQGSADTNAHLPR